MEKRFWKPSITSQFKHCPVHYHLDTYKGCSYNCLYCFSRDLTTFARRKSEHKEFHYLVGNRPDLLEKWFDKILNKEEYDYTKAEEVAFKERIPLKIGAGADPFPPVEKTEKITHDVLMSLKKIDYPVELQTKNPEGFLNYAEEFIGMNLTIAVTLISADDKFSKAVEPCAPSPTKRLEAIKKLTDMGFNVMIKMQPAIYPKIIEDLPELVKVSKEAGAWGFNIEGLKCRISMPKDEQALFQTIGDYLGFNIREFYRDERKKEGNKGSDYELSNEKKREIFELATKLSKEYNIKFFNADNYLDKKYGCSCECCGTEKLRNYKLLDCDSRSLLYGNKKGSKELEKCKVNFIRGNKYQGLTIREACELENNKNDNKK